MRICLFLILILSFACKNDINKRNFSKVEKLKYFWEINLILYGSPSDPEFSVSIKNDYDSIYINRYRYLHDFSQNTFRKKTESYTAKYCSTIEKDSIHTLTKNILKDFDFPKHDKWIDGLTISIELIENGNSLKCRLINIGGIENCPSDVKKLIKFINKRLDESDKIY